MIVTVSAIAATAAGLVFSSGYLFGAKRGVNVREALEEEERQATMRADRLEERVAALASAANDAQGIRTKLEAVTRSLEGRDETSVVQSLRTELHSLSTQIKDRETKDIELRAELRDEIASLARSGNDPVRFEQELRRIVGPLLARQNDTHGLRELVQKTLSPILDKERLGRELAQLESGSSLGELPRILDAIAQKGGFSSVVLSDDVGLPLAASTAAKSVDWLAGMASLVLTLVERSERVGEPKPIGVVVHDESNQMLLHRIFRVGNQQFLLTAVSRGQDVAPSALDPALAKIERALSRPELQV